MILIFSFLFLVCYVGCWKVIKFFKFADHMNWSIFRKIYMILYYFTSFSKKFLNSTFYPFAKIWLRVPLNNNFKKTVLICSFAKLVALFKEAISFLLFHLLFIQCRILIPFIFLDIFCIFDTIIVWQLKMVFIFRIKKVNNEQNKFKQK